MPQVIRPFYVNLGNSGRRDLTVCEGEVRYTFDGDELPDIDFRFFSSEPWRRLSAIEAGLFDVCISLADLRAMAEADREAAEFAAPVTIVTDPEGVA